METKIVIVVVTYTAREQEILVRQRECANYYESRYEGSLREEANKIIKKHTDCSFDILTDTDFIENDSVSNSIIFSFYNPSDFKPDELRKDLAKYIEDKFKGLFNIT